MFRFIGGLISIVSLLFCIGASILWARSRNHTDLLLIQTTRDHLVGGASVRGVDRPFWAAGMMLAATDMPYTGSVDENLVAHPIAPMEQSPDNFKSTYYDVIFDPATTVKFSLVGFKTAVGQSSLTPTLNIHFSAMVLPYWLLVAGSALVALWGCRSIWIHWRRVRLGLCLGCGYDIRASTGRCPECGKEIPVPAKATAAS
jgi:hypothetical protein